MKDCFGLVRVIGSRPGIVGTDGGLGGPSVGEIDVTQEGAQIKVDQWGVDKPTIRQEAGSISGTFSTNNGPVSFSGISGVIGSSSKSGQQNLANWDKNNITVLELPSLTGKETPPSLTKDPKGPNAEGTIKGLPFGQPCPKGTFPTNPR
jgi:hypothetical protein